MMKERKGRRVLRRCEECAKMFVVAFNWHFHRIAPLTGEKVYRHRYCSYKCRRAAYIWRRKLYGPPFKSKRRVTE